MPGLGRRVASLGSAAGPWPLPAAAVIGAYMAMNIGANDVANNVGPAVGSNTLTLTWAIVIAAIFESAGAIIVGRTLSEFDSDFAGAVNPVPGRREVGNGVDSSIHSRPPLTEGFAATVGHASRHTRRYERLVYRSGSASC